MVIGNDITIGTNDHTRTSTTLLAGLLLLFVTLWNTEEFKEGIKSTTETAVTTALDLLDHFDIDHTFDIVERCRLLKKVSKY